MIHVATVHWRSDRWIEPQLRYLDRHLGPHRVYAFLNEVPGDHREKFFYASTERIRDHATKLNLLGDAIALGADPSDPILFVDGDAFPIAPLAPLIEGRLERHKLIAVQRYENNGDLQPHPCFCLTTVGFWKAIEGDWHRGHTWLNLQGEPITDVGGNLLGALELAGVDWYPLRRRNGLDLNPLFFAVYGDDEHGGVAYHHGAGFRNMSESGGGRVGGLAIQREAGSLLRSRIMGRLPDRGPLGALRERHHPVKRLERRRRAEAVARSEEIRARIERDEEFWKTL